MTMSGGGRLVVVGASLAGLRAVEGARKAGHRGEIVMVGDETRLPYDRPPLSKAFLDPSLAVAPDTTFRSEEHLRSELDVDLKLGVRAESLHPADGVIRLASGDLAYDALVIATGAQLRSLPAGDGLNGVYGLRSLDDARAIRAAIGHATCVVVVGAGFIGSEIASMARRRGLEVTIVEASSEPLARALGAAGTWVAGLHRQHGTTLITGRTVAALRGTDKVTGVVLDDGVTLDADLVVVGIGVDPAVGWLQGSGLDITGGVGCDEHLFTGTPGVFAAGDVARWHNSVYGQFQRMENWTAAAEQGGVAGHNAVVPREEWRRYATVPYFWSDWYDSRIQFVGTAEADELVLVEGNPAEDRRWVCLYRLGGRLVGALAVNAPTEVMKYRGLIQRQAEWADAVEFAQERARKRAAGAKLAEIN